MALSQCLEDSPSWRTPRLAQDSNLKELYNERHRLALEELVSGGVDSFMDFLKKERIPNFLSDEEIRRITRAAVVPRSVSLIGDETHLDQSGTLDCSSVTYFPEISDIEPPLLEIGWPGFTKGSFRGVTRAVAYFQPSYGECIYSCKEAARRMIKSAKEVIAIVTDSLTDLDIFRDLQEACCQRRVPVYVLLEQSSLPAFLQMCRNLNVHLDELQHMRVRTITGSTYYMRSGARITGKVHERFMLIDGNRVATGSYRFNWTDGKLNSSNLIELSGQITENFDEEFRILYAQSLQVNTRAPSSVRNSGMYDHLLLKIPGTPASQPSRTAKPELVCLTSTPNRHQAAEIQPLGKEKETDNKKSNLGSDTSTLGDDWMEQELREDVISAGDPLVKAGNVNVGVSNGTQTTGTMTSPAALCCHASTQTTGDTSDSAVQTEMPCEPQQPSPSSPSSTSSGRGDSSGDSSTTSSTPPAHSPAPKEAGGHPLISSRAAPEGSSLRECFCRLAKERQHHYTTIRAKLDHMMMMLSHRREWVDHATALGTGPHAGLPGQAESRHIHSVMESVLMGTWPRSRCLQ
ncbi:protein FAM83D [Brachyhypopomus gauderio]|uniref:protein FAM83D n=1 Tax=Brachyhypopomus gauderio TaxID=698409 RepID=UPI00404363D3